MVRIQIVAILIVLTVLMGCFCRSESPRKAPTAQIPNGTPPIIGHEAPYKPYPQDLTPGSTLKITDACQKKTERCMDHCQTFSFPVSALIGLASYSSHSSVSGAQGNWSGQCYANCRASACGP